MRGGTGLMGEAGPEAILPLQRGADGRLGVAGGGGAVNVTMNITTPDAQGFRRSQSQIAAEMGRALARGQRNR
jgi:phage-related minor tail protein